MTAQPSYEIEPRLQALLAQDAGLAQVFAEALPEIEKFLLSTGLRHRLEARLTRGGEYLIRMQVAYRSREERDRIWDRAAQILERARAGRDIHILCGISRLPPAH
ncbi:MAG TPA: hypothetical protein ENI38_04450 [Candidatus Acetothermia bacterium]|nr:hypothetical protein [Candidatus Acetothermia bacterium]